MTTKVNGHSFKVFNTLEEGEEAVEDIQEKFEDLRDAFEEQNWEEVANQLDELENITGGLRVLANEMQK